MGYASAVATSLSVDLTGMNTTFRLQNAHSGAIFYDLRPHEASRQRTLVSGTDVRIANLLPIKNGYAVYDGNDTSTEPLFNIRIQGAPGYPPVVFAEFKDVTTGEICRLLVEGQAEDRVVLVTLERGPTLSPILKEKNDRNPKAFTIVGRLRRPETNGIVFEGRERMYIEAEAGVDLAVLSMLWCVRYELYYKAVVTGGPYTRYVRADLQDTGVAI